LSAFKDYPAFSVEVSGHFSSVVDFFEKLENMPYFVRPLIVDISLEEEKGAPAGTPVFLENEIPDGKNVKMKIVFVVYGN
jgi:hypothetical protein